MVPKIYVHHRNGEIAKIELTATPDDIGAEVVEAEGIDSINSIGLLTHKVVDGRVVEKNAAEKRLANLPTTMEARGAVFLELQATDFTQLPDTKFTDEERAHWRAYRHALRRLSKFPDGAAMVANWPRRPDGEDPIFHLRARLG